MFHVYLLRSSANPAKTYVGFTSLPVEERLDAHNAGRVPYTARYRPWDLIAVISVSTKDKAIALEAYLKSGSGHAFAHMHLW